MKNMLKSALIVTIILFASILFSGCDVFKINSTTITNINYNISTYTLEGGSITGAGSYKKGATVTLTATPDEGYFFVNWTSGQEVVHTENTYTFIATQNVVLYANFISLSGNYAYELEGEYIVLELNTDITYKMYTYNSQIQDNYTLEELEGTYAIEGSQLILNTDDEGTFYTYDFSISFDILNLSNETVNYNFEKYLVSTIEGVYAGTNETDYFIYDFDADSYLIEAYEYNEQDDELQFNSKNYSYKIFKNRVMYYVEETEIYLTFEFIISGQTLTLNLPDSITLIMTSFTMPDIYYNFISMNDGSQEIEFLENNVLIQKEHMVIDGVTQTTEVSNTYYIIKNYLFITNSIDGKITLYEYTLDNEILTISDLEIFFKEGVTPQFTVRTNSTIDATYITGLGTYDYNETVTLSVTPRNGYTFVGWRVDGKIISTNTSYSFIIRNDVTVTAIWTYNGIGFEPVPN